MIIVSRSYQNYQNGAVSKQLTVGGMGGGGGGVFGDDSEFVDV